MANHRSTATIVGVLFLIAFVTYALDGILVTPILSAPVELTTVATSSDALAWGSLLVLLGAASVISIPIALFPILRRRHEALALGYVGARAVEGLLSLVGVVALQSLVTLSQHQPQGDPSTSPSANALATVLVAAQDWAFLIGSTIAFCLSALILYSLLYRTRLVPRFISVWGLVAATLWLATGALGLFGYSFDATWYIWSLPIMTNELFLAVWLIVRGFNRAAASPGRAVPT
ncbi:MAG: DUF4386 domain-containing protein [Deinococcales bacterium]